MTHEPTPATPDQLDTLRGLDALLRPQRRCVEITWSADASEFHVRIFEMRSPQTDMFEKRPKRERDVLGFGADESLQRAVLEAWDEACGERKGAAE